MTPEYWATLMPMILEDRLKNSADPSSSILPVLCLTRPQRKNSAAFANLKTSFLSTAFASFVADFFVGQFPAEHDGDILSSAGPYLNRTTSLHLSRETKRPIV